MLKYRCLSLCKDTNFKANHNLFVINYFVMWDVCLCAKIRILKQITTSLSLLFDCLGMFVFVQRYEF